MAQYTLETDPQARAEHIFEMTGIQPDPRFHIPAAETDQLIRNYQSGDTNSGLKLVARRLNWTYTHFAALAPVREREDLELEDIMQIGCLATLDAAKNLTLDTTIPTNTKFKIAVPRVMGSILMQTKLLPFHAVPSRPSYSSSGILNDMSHGIGLANGVPENIEAAQDSTINKERLCDRTIPVVSIENDLFSSDDYLSPLVEELIDAYDQIAGGAQEIRKVYGLGEDIQTIAERAAKYGITRQAMDIRLAKCRKKMRELPEFINGQYALLLEDDHTNYGLTA